LALKTACNSLENSGFIVDLPVENRDFPSFFGCLPEGNYLVVSTYPSEK